MKRGERIEERARFSRTPGLVASRLSLAGEHTRDVLVEAGIDAGPLLRSIPPP